MLVMEQECAHSLHELLRSEILLLQEQERDYTIALVPPTSSFIDNLLTIIDKLTYPTMYIEDRNEYVMTVNTHPLTELLIRIYPRPTHCVFDKTYDKTINTKRYITITRRKGVMNYRAVQNELCHECVEQKWTLYHLTN